MTAAQEAELTRLGRLDALEVIAPPTYDARPGPSIRELEAWSTRTLMRSLLRRNQLPGRRRPSLDRFAPALAVIVAIVLVVLAFQQATA